MIILDTVERNMNVEVYLYMLSGQSRYPDREKSPNREISPDRDTLFREISRSG